MSHYSLCFNLTLLRQHVVYALPLLKYTPPPPPLHVRRRCLWNQADMGEVSRPFTKEELLCGLAHIWD